MFIGIERAEGIGAVAVLGVLVSEADAIVGAWGSPRERKIERKKYISTEKQ
jgi:hypothetical protein